MTAFALDEDDNDFDFQDAGDNPDLANAAASMAASGGATPPPDLIVPQDGPVSLVAGFRRLVPGGVPEEVTTAWVKELDGSDEERIVKARYQGTMADFLQTILECGVEKLGDKKPTSDELMGLVQGDRDFLLTEISRSTYGDELEFTEFQCEHCREVFDFTIQKSDDIPVRRLSNMDEVEFDVTLRKGQVATVSLPTGNEQKKMFHTDNPAEANTVILANCVQAIDGEPVAGDATRVRKLGLRDRHAIIEEMGKRMPGPQYDGVKFNHEPGCGKEIRLTVTLADLFRGL